MRFRGQRTEDRGQILVRASRGLLKRRGAAATKSQSSILNPQSSVLSPQSSALRPQSSALIPQSSIFRPQSSVLCPLSSERGFTLIELIIVIIIIVVLMGLFLNRALFYQEQAEKTAMEGVAGAIQSALILQYGQILTRGTPSDLPVLVQDNPMNWLQKKPRNYAGEFYDPTPLTAESGNWVFDLKTRDLIYIVRNANYFKPGKDGKKWIRFHVAVQHEPSRLPSLRDAPPELTGTLFEPVEPYAWF